MIHDYADKSYLRAGDRSIKWLAAIAFAAIALVGLGLAAGDPRPALEYVVPCSGARS